MTREEELLAPLVEACGLELKPDSDGLCDLGVEDRLVTLRYVEIDRSWQMMTAVSLPPEAALTPARLRKALELTLLGTGTNGCLLGLLGDTFILSRCVDADGLEPEVFADNLHLLARTAGQVVEALTADPADNRAAAPGNLKEVLYV